MLIKITIFNDFQCTAEIVQPKIRICFEARNRKKL